MHSFRTILAIGLSVFGVAASAIHPHPNNVNKSPNNPSTASVTDDHMGPSAFMWPPDRVWSGDMGNQAPCGSRASAGNRTVFPLTGGAIALVAQDDYYDSKISISYSNDPKSNADFSPLVETADISDLNPGHTCIKIPDAPVHIAAGINATLQIIYKADWDAPHNQTFYACADITYVETTAFSERIPCFNATEPGADDIAAASVTKSQPSGGASSSGVPGSSGSEKPSMGTAAIAAAICGSLVGVSMLAAGVFLLYRRRRQQKRSRNLSQMEDARGGPYPVKRISSEST